MIERKKRRTNKQFLQEVYKQVGNEYTFLEEYKGVVIKIKVRHNCKKCNNYEWFITPDQFLHSKSRCPKCFGNIKKTTEQYKIEVYNLVGNEYTILGEYINAKTKIKIRHNCNKCDNYEWEILPPNILKGHGCPICGIDKLTMSQRKTHSEFLKEIYNSVRDEYSVLEKYVNDNTPILMRHNCSKCDNYT